jgi:hypothetical protein
MFRQSNCTIQIITCYSTADASTESNANQTLIPTPTRERRKIQLRRPLIQFLTRRPLIQRPLTSERAGALVRRRPQLPSSPAPHRTSRSQVSLLPKRRPRSSAPPHTRPRPSALSAAHGPSVRVALVQPFAPPQTSELGEWEGGWFRLGRSWTGY